MNQLMSLAILGTSALLIPIATYIGRGCLGVDRCRGAKSKAGLISLYCPGCRAPSWFDYVGYPEPVDISRGCWARLGLEDW